MRSFLSFVLMGLAVILGIYAGVWWAFIGGIMQVIEAMKAPEVEALGAALGVLRVMSASFIGFVTFGLVSTVAICWLD